MKFKKADWINNTNVYEVNIRQYTEEGTFNAFAKALPRLKEMGVATLWLMPITPIAQQHKKGTMGSPYACSDYTSINPEFGTLDDFKALVQLAHSMGFKLIVDWVANHTGWDHVWTVTHPEYFKKDEQGQGFKIASGMDDIIELDYQHPPLRQAMIEAMQYWVTECDIDGFRCDLAFWVTLDFWIEARTELEKFKTLFWLAESDPIEHPAYFKAFDACYAWTWMHKTEEFYKRNQDVHLLKHVLYQYDNIVGPNDTLLWFTSNHDENTWNGTEYEKYGDAAKALAVLSFTRAGIPLIYSGQELPSHKRLQFFDKDTIDWKAPFMMEEFYNTLLKLRKYNPALRAGDAAVTTIDLHNSTPNNVLAYLRKNGDREVLVLLNMSAHQVHCYISDHHVNGNYKNIFTKESADFTHQKQVDLQPWAYAVYEK